MTCGGVCDGRAVRVPRAFACWAVPCPRCRERDGEQGTRRGFPAQQRRFLLALAVCRWSLHPSHYECMLVLACVGRVRRRRRLSPRSEPWMSCRQVLDGSRRDVSGLRALLPVVVCSCAPASPFRRSMRQIIGCCCRR